MAEGHKGKEEGIRKKIKGTGNKNFLRLRAYLSVTLPRRQAGLCNSSSHGAAESGSCRISRVWFSHSHGNFGMKWPTRPYKITGFFNGDAILC